MQLTPVKIVAASGPDEHLDTLRGLTIRRVGKGRPVHVIRHGTTDIIRANARPFYIVGISGIDGSISKASWHSSAIAALRRFDGAWPNLVARVLIDASGVT